MEAGLPDPSEPLGPCRAGLGVRPASAHADQQTGPCPVQGVGRWAGLHGQPVVAQLGAPHGLCPLTPWHPLPRTQRAALFVWFPGQQVHPERRREGPAGWAGQGVAHCPGEALLCGPQWA